MLSLSHRIEDKNTSTIHLYDSFSAFASLSDMDITDDSVLTEKRKKHDFPDLSSTSNHKSRINIYKKSDENEFDPVSNHQLPQNKDCDLKMKTEPKSINKLRDGMFFHLS
ncbi:hypothetical protein AVEN_227830-1 [Araneus ventricosus]|uniref:Uncharacterized protein n=1 Tax=Araneus ventricosus TaxID=182803 RepID=A0A4Y2NN24_ARAVE|nr:hypothetical protein AVEN_227830-1 [Araneus ventricosus]